MAPSAAPPNRHVNPTLHIIANCTDTKTAVPSIRLRDVPAGTPAERVDRWWELVLETQDNASPAVNLYAGGNWSVFRSLPEIANRAGFAPHLWVISAGLGFISANASIGPYSATFTSSHEDSIFRPSNSAVNRGQFHRDWWAELASRRHPASTGPRSIADLVETSPDASYLVVASSEYLQPIADDLKSAVTRLRNANSLVLISNADQANRLGLAASVVPSDPRLQARDLTGQRSVGGSRIALHANVSKLVLERVAEGAWSLGAREIRNALSTLVDASPPLANYGRRLLTDEQVRTFIRQSVLELKSPSCAALLRKLRDAGSACEQKRFRGLFHAEVRMDAPVRGRR